jgi:lysophospholipase L1-like esterase
MATEDVDLADDGVADALMDRWVTNAPWRRFVVLGDGCARRPAGEAQRHRHRPWPRQVACPLQRQQPDLAYLNLARNAALIPVVRAQQLQPALEFRPDLAVIMCGGGDALRPSFDTDTVEMELTRIVAALRGMRCEVVIIGPFDFAAAAWVPPQQREQLRSRLRLLTERLQAVALRLGALHVDLVSHPASRDPATHGADGRQLNARGHSIVAGEVLRRLAARLGNELTDKPERG